ncbi:acyltransferase [Bdellovibrio svalbardensis]|uniref:Acyltransferase n=1 Tax=Bdellovibrio svalbardensis TaxID=2972972 RepID=A0ABT6DK90_9BACT|nr:acyltransferase [Bdellovibrio svalbardensis]MDG0815523.1 acyltransferase [Bdellovibrio svalbardensis]
MKKAAVGARLIFGLLWLVFGLNFFFHFLPQPPPSEAGLKFLSGLMAAPYFFMLLKVTEIAVGVMLLANIAVPLALVVISPIVIQILLYHTVLDTSGAGIALVMTAFNLFLGIAYFQSFKPLFKKV